MKKCLNYIFIFFCSLFAVNSEYLILCPSALNDAAQIISNLHSNEIEESFQLTTDIIYTDDVYSLYPNQSPEQSIRTYMINEIASNANAKYLLLLGDEISIPPIRANNQSPSDDFYTSEIQLQGDPQLSTGRIPVNSAENGLKIVNKIRDYILDPTQGDWRSRMVLVSDDENKEGAFNYNEFSHTLNSDKIYDKLNDKLVIYQIYGPEYEPVNGPSGLLHQNMNNDILELINSGVSLINYIGHGSPIAWSDEKILDMERDLDFICSPGTECYDNKKQPIWIVGTCSFGEYDETNSMTEELLKSDFGGIAVIATTRGVGVSTNINYLENFFDNVSDFISNNNDSRLGDIVRLAKQATNNDYLFHTFGDPALILPFPKLSTELIDDNSIDGFQVLSDQYINIHQNQSASIQISTNDFETSYTINDSLISYSKPGQIIYQGYFEDETCFRIPLDSNVCDTCTVSFSLYADDSDYNGHIQHINNIPLLEFSDDILDVDGPGIKLYQTNSLINSGSVINRNYPINIHVFDNLGVNLMEEFQHNIRYWFNNQPYYYTANSNIFEYINGCDSGHVSINLPSDIQTGTHIMHIEAWDNANNRTQNDIELIVRANESTFIHDIYNIPNPITDNTYFTFYLANYPAEVEIEIFSVDGKKVKTIPNQTYSSYYNTIFWDGKGDYYDNLPNGPYFYHLHAKYQDMEFENIFKLAIIK